MYPIYFIQHNIYKVTPYYNMYQDFIPFLKVNDIPLYNTSLLFTREPVDGHLGCFLILAVVNNAAINMSGEVSVHVPAFNFRSEIARSR